MKKINNDCYLILYFFISIIFINHLQADTFYTDQPLPPPPNYKKFQQQLIQNQYQAYLNYKKQRQQAAYQNALLKEQLKSTDAADFFAKNQSSAPLPNLFHHETKTISKKIKNNLASGLSKKQTANLIQFDNKKVPFMPLFMQKSKKNKATKRDNNNQTPTKQKTVPKLQFRPLNVPFTP